MPNVLTSDGFQILLRWNAKDRMFNVEIFDTESTRENEMYSNLIFFAAAETVDEIDNTIGQFGFYINDTMREAVEEDCRDTLYYDKLLDEYLLEQ